MTCADARGSRRGPRKEHAPLPRTRPAHGPGLPNRTRGDTHQAPIATIALPHPPPLSSTHILGRHVGSRREQRLNGLILGIVRSPVKGGLALRRDDGGMEAADRGGQQSQGGDVRGGREGAGRGAVGAVGTDGGERRGRDAASQDRVWGGEMGQALTTRPTE